MDAPTEPIAAVVGNQHDGIAVVYCNEAFTFAAGHRMRAARCLICQECIGGAEATVVGAAALAGEACRCGGIVSDVFLVHAAHLPMEPVALQTAIRRGLECKSC